MDRKVLGLILLLAVMVSVSGVILSHASIPNGWWYNNWFVEKNVNATVSIKTPEIITDRLYFDLINKDVYIYRSSSNVIRTPDAFMSDDSFILNNNGGGIYFGLSSDTHLYRSGVNELTVSGSLITGGNVSIGGNSIKTTNLLIREKPDESNYIEIKTSDGLSWRNLVLNYIYTIQGGRFSGALQIDAGLVADSADGQFFTLKGKATGVGLVEVARVQGAIDPYFSMGGSQQFTFSNAGIATLSGTVNMPYYSGDYGVLWNSGLPNPSGTINGGVMMVYNSNAGVLSSRIYIYSNGAWHYVVLS